MAFQDNRIQRLQASMDEVKLRKNRDIIGAAQARDASTPMAKGVGILGNKASIASSPLGKLMGASSSSSGMSDKLDAAQSIAGADEGTTSTSEGAVGGVVSGASAGAAFGPVGAGIGAVVGGITGGLKARSRRKKAVAEIQAQKTEKLGQIESDKAQRLNEAMRSMASNMGSVLNNNIQL